MPLHRHPKHRTHNFWLMPAPECYNWGGRDARHECAAPPRAVRNRAIAARSQAARRASPGRHLRPLLSDITVEHGPVDLHRPPVPQGRHLGAPRAASAVVRADAGPDRHQSRQPRHVAPDPAAVRSRVRRHHRRQRLLHPRPQRQGRDRGDAGRPPLPLGRHLVPRGGRPACACSTPSPSASRARRARRGDRARGQAAHAAR